MSEYNKTPECLLPALRQYRHNRDDDLVVAYDYVLVNKEIATKDAELARLREALHEIIEQGRTGEDAYVMADLALEALKSQ